MDRNKPALGTRGPKSKITQQPPDLFIALGAKAGSSRDSDPKRNVPILPKSTQISSPNSKGKNYNFNKNYVKLIYLLIH